jgi:hypothetical protein
MKHQTQAQLQPVSPGLPALDPDKPEQENLIIEAARGQNSVTRIVRALAQRRMGLTALLFIAAHEPAAFLAGQCLYLLAPTYRILTADTAWEGALDEWAELLSRPEGLRELETLCRS